MKIAKAKVWADKKGRLVKDGDDSAEFLVAAAGQPVPDSIVKPYQNADEFFRDAVYDGDGKLTEPKPVTTAAPPAPPPPAAAEAPRDPDGQPAHKPKK